MCDQFDFVGRAFLGLAVDGFLIWFLPAQTCRGCHCADLRCGVGLCLLHLGVMALKILWVSARPVQSERGPVSDDWKTPYLTGLKFGRRLALWFVQRVFVPLRG